MACTEADGSYFGFRNNVNKSSIRLAFPSYRFTFEAYEGFSKEYTDSQTDEELKFLEASRTFSFVAAMCRYLSLIL